MFRKITLISSLLFFLFGANVFAHSHIEDSTPKNGEVITEPLKNITLNFETAIEPTSSFTLSDANGTEVSLPEVTINGNQLLTNVENELANGAYTIHWKIIGEDGHLLEGDIPFTVQLPEIVEQSAASETVVTTSADSQTTTENVRNDTATEQVAVEKEAESEEPAMMNYIIPGLIGLIIMVGFVSYWFIFRRKQA